MEGQRTTTNLVSGNNDAGWLVHDGHQQWGPYPTEKVIDLLKRKRIDWMWNVWREGMDRWRPTANLFTNPELADDGQIRLRDFNHVVMPKKTRKQKEK